MSPPASRAVVIDARADALRRELGPTAWAALEILLLNVDPLSDERCVCTNVRDVAQRLGIAKDTAAKALRRLAAAGLVSARSTRSAAGTFGTVSYIVDTVRLVGIDVVRLDAAPGVGTGKTSSAKPPRTRPSTPAQHTVVHRQPELFDVSGPQR